MGSRILKESICTSDSIDQLSWFEECLFYRLIVNADDFGILDGRMSILKAKLFPLKNVTDKQITDALNKLSSAGIVSLETYKLKPYLQIITWADHQQIRNKKSKYVPINDSGIPTFDSKLISTDIKCNQMIAQSNPIQSESNSNTIQSSQKDFDVFWNAYPKKLAKQDAVKAWAKIKNVELEIILSALKNQKKSAEWLKDGGKFVPHPATWLNGKRWEDEVGESYGSDIDSNGKSENAMANTTGVVSSYSKTV